MTHQHELIETITETKVLIALTISPTGEEKRTDTHYYIQPDHLVESNCEKDRESRA
jgi:hypothetical protein